MLHLHLSNRPEALAAALAAVQRIDPLPLLEVEPVVIPSTALARWLDFRLADALGVAVQTAFMFPAAYVWQLFGRVLPGLAASDPFDRAAMHWRLVRLLEASGAPEVRHYLAGDDGTRCHELAGRLAGLFERYLVERPDWIAAWNAGRRLGLGPDEGWQADAWRALFRELTAQGVSASHPRERFIAALEREAGLRRRLPRRISLFAVEAMPDLYWEVFARLAEWLDLHVFVLAPTREYWGDIERTRERLRLEIESPAAAALLETAHPLLASLGRARRHAAVRLADAAAGLASATHEYFAAPPLSLLGALQRDLLELRQSDGVPVDASLRIHDCHGATREAEVLHDLLLALFESLPDLRPADILILVPDIETYAPLLEAVLTHAAPGRRIPCAVADRPLAETPMWRTLCRLCAAAAGELDAESVMGLLEEPALRRAFGITESDVPPLRDWIGTAGIRWGLDAETRRRRDLPPADAHTWRAGLRRLLLGVAMPDAPERLCDGALPAVGIEGGRAELLGRFLDFAEALFDLHAKVGAGRTAGAWADILLDVLERCVVPTEDEETGRQRVRTAILALADAARTAGCDTRLPLAVILRELDAALVERASARAFASGAATIAALRPGRPLPARVVCLVGMNDEAWPRPANVPGFDLIAAHPRPGDRDRRLEERHAFLEALLCARDALVVTYAGRDPRSNLAAPPAAPLAELIDTLAAMTGCPPDALIVRHPLQPFSPAYFDGADTALFGFDDTQCAASGRVGGARAIAPFCAGPRDEAEVSVEAELVELSELLAFFVHPARHFLRTRLGIHLEESEELLEIHEPFVTDRLQAHRLRAAHLDGLRAGAGREETTRLLDARGWLPHGVAGTLASERAAREAGPVWEEARSWAAAERLPPLPVRWDDGSSVLVGSLEGLTTRGLWRLRAGNARPQDYLHLWIEHLLLQLAAPPGVPCRGALVARDGTIQLEPVLQPEAHLAELLALYRRGLRAPLPFYPRTAWAWLEGKAGWRTVWSGSDFYDREGEGEDPYWRLALRDRADDPLGEEFRRVATTIFSPLFAAIGKKVGHG